MPPFIPGEPIVYVHDDGRLQLARYVEHDPALGHVIRWTDQQNWPHRKLDAQHIYPLTTPGLNAAHAKANELALAEARDNAADGVEVETNEYLISTLEIVSA